MVWLMGRRRICEEDRVATAVRLPVSVHRQLRDAALSRDVSANLLVTRAITDYLERLPSLDEQLTALETDSDRLSP